MDASNFECLPDLSDLLELEFPWEFEACSALLSPEQLNAAPSVQYEQSQGVTWTGSDCAEPVKAGPGAGAGSAFHSSQDRRGATLQCQQSNDAAHQQDFQPQYDRDASWSMASASAPAFRREDNRAVSIWPGACQGWHDSASQGLPDEPGLGIANQMLSGHWPSHNCSLQRQPGAFHGQHAAIQAAPKQPRLTCTPNGDSAQQLFHPAGNAQHVATEHSPAACSPSEDSSTALIARIQSTHSLYSDTKQSDGSSTDAGTELPASVAALASPGVMQPAHSRLMPKNPQIQDSRILSQVSLTQGQPQPSSAAIRPQSHLQTQQPSLATVKSCSAPVSSAWLGQSNASGSGRATLGPASMEARVQDVFWDSRAARGFVSPIFSGPEAEPSKPAKRQRSLAGPKLGTKHGSAAATRIQASHMHRKHVSSLQELELNRLLDNLQQPQDSSFPAQPHSINALHSINEARKLPGYGQNSQPDQLRMRSVKETLVHPGWNAVLPCDASVYRLYEALDTGCLDIPVDLVMGSGQRFTSLRELTAISAEQQGPILVDATMRMVNANHFKLAKGDACHQAVLKNMGAILLFSTAFHQLAGGLDLQGTSMLDSSSSDPSSTRPDAARLRRCIGLDATQKRAARHVWKETSTVLARLEHERGELVSRMGSGPLHADPVLARLASCPHDSPSTEALLQQVSQLSQNAQLQAEWVRIASRKLVWQVLSPEGMIRLSCLCWPIVPDLLYVLQALADS